MDAWPFKSKLGSWEVRRRDRDDIWGQAEREAERQRLTVAEEVKIKNRVCSERGNERKEDDFKGLD